MKQHKNLKPILITSAVALVLGAGIFCLIFFLLGKGYAAGSDAAILTSAILLATAGFIFISRNGFFDFVSYGFKQLGSQLFSKNPNEHNDFVSYKTEKNALREKRTKYYLGFIFVGLAFLVASIVLLILFNNSIK